MGLYELILQNIWISYVSIIIWFIDILFLITLDIRVLRGRGDEKIGKKFVNPGLTWLKYIIGGIILLLTLILSIVGISFIFGREFSTWIFFIFFIISIFIMLPWKMLEKGPASDFGLRWIINILDRSDKKNK